MTTINSSSNGDYSALASMANAQYGNGGRPNRGNWFEAMASAWGRTLNSQADTIKGLSEEISAGNDQPSVITQLTAESLRMGFLSTSSHTAISSSGEALKTMAQK